MNQTYCFVPAQQQHPPDQSKLDGIFDPRFKMAQENLNEGFSSFLCRVTLLSLVRAMNLDSVLEHHAQVEEFRRRHKKDAVQALSR